MRASARITLAYGDETIEVDVTPFGKRWRALAAGARGVFGSGVTFEECLLEVLHEFEESCDNRARGIIPVRSTMGTGSMPLTPNLNWVAIIHTEDEGGYWAEIPAMPGCVARGDTMEEVKANIPEAVEVWLLTAKDFDLTPVVETCDQGHKFAKLPDHPRRDGLSRCPHCMAEGLRLMNKRLEQLEEANKYPPKPGSGSV